MTFAHLGRRSMRKWPSGVFSYRHTRLDTTAPFSAGMRSAMADLSLSSSSALTALDPIRVAHLTRVMPRDFDSGPFDMRKAVEVLARGNLPQVHGQPAL